MLWVNDRDTVVLEYTATYKREKEWRRAFKKTISTSHSQNPSDTSKTLHSARVEITTAEQSATRWESICWY